VIRWFPTWLERIAAGLSALVVVAALSAAWPLDKPHAVVAALGLCGILLSSATFRHRWKRILVRSTEQSPALREALATRAAGLAPTILSIALLVIAGETGCTTYRKEIIGSALTGFEYFLRVPLGDLMLFGVAGVLTYLAGRPFRRSAPWSLNTTLFMGVLAWALLAVKSIHHWALVFVALGVATQLGRVAWRHLWLTQQVFRRALPFLAGLVVIPALVASFGPGWLESRKARDLPPAPANRPNILLIVADTLRASSLGTYGYARATSPNLDRFGTKGAVFETAIAPAPWTLASHASMFTARMPSELTAGFATPLDGTYPTIGEALTAGGYRTAGFVANPLYGSKAYGLARGFQHYEERKTDLETSLLSTSLGSMLLRDTKLQNRLQTNDNFGRKSARQIREDLIAWIDGNDGSRPFFAFLNLFDAHAPYLPPGEFATRFSPTTPRGNLESRPYNEWSPAEIRELNNAYDGAIAYLDDQLGRLFEQLAERGLIDKTVIVITADHGEHFGEHDLLEHSASLYLPLLHVPLIVVHPPTVPAASRVTDIVSLRDLPLTFLEIAGLANGQGFPGHSLLRMATGGGHGDGVVMADAARVTTAYPDSYPARKGAMKTIFGEGFQYIRNEGTKREELYSLRDDPAQLNDLVGANSPVLSTLRQRLDADLARRRPRIR